MGEPSKDKRGATAEPTKDTQKSQGWIRIHSDENAKTPLVEKFQNDELHDIASQPPGYRVRKLDKPVE